MRPVAKFWLSVNHKPRVSDDSYGFWRCVRLIPFTQQFTDNADSKLEEKLMGELPGILAWLVRGCREWETFGLKPPGAVLEATETYREESDLIADFIDERCMTGKDCSATAKDLYQAYRAWAADQGWKEREILTATAFGRRMGDRFERGKSKTGRFYVGVQLCW